MESLRLIRRVALYLFGNLSYSATEPEGGRPPPNSSPNDTLEVSRG